MAALRLEIPTVDQLLEIGWRQDALGRWFAPGKFVLFDGIACPYWDAVPHSLEQAQHVGAYIYVTPFL